MGALRFASCIAFILIAKSFAIDEPICSKFDYEEKLLAKMIRMEIEMERMKLDMETNIETRINQAFENLTLTVNPPIIAFSAYNPAKMTYVQDETIVFESVLLNEDSGYDTSTGVFTARVKGLYHFTVHVCNKMQWHSIVAITHNGVKIALSTQYDNYQSACGSVSALIKVDVGDKVYVISAHPSTKISENLYRRMSFMGFLIRAIL